MDDKWLDSLYSGESIIEWYEKSISSPLEYDMALIQLAMKRPELSISRFEQTVTQHGHAFMEDRMRGKGRPRCQDMFEMIKRPRPATRWVVDELMSGGGLSMLSAKPKAGKSTLTRWLTASIVAGTPFLGRVTRPGRVLFCELDEPNHIGTAEDLEKFAKGLNFLDDEYGKGSRYLDSFPAAQDPIAELGRVIASCKPTLVIVDTLMNLLGYIVDDDNSYAVTTRAMSRVKSMLKNDEWASMNTHIMFIQHCGKGSMGGDRHSASIGSTGWRAATDLNLTLTNEKGKYIIWESEGRHTRDIAPMEIRLIDNVLEFHPLKDRSVIENAMKRAITDGLELMPMNSGEIQSHLYEEYGYGRRQSTTAINELKAIGVIGKTKESKSKFVVLIPDFNFEMEEEDE